MARLDEDEGTAWMLVARSWKLEAGSWKLALPLLPRRGSSALLLCCSSAPPRLLTSAPPPSAPRVLAREQARARLPESRGIRALAKIRSRSPSASIVRVMAPADAADQSGRRSEDAVDLLLFRQLRLACQRLLRSTTASGSMNSVAPLPDWSCTRPGMRPCELGAQRDN